MPIRAARWFTPIDDLLRARGRFAAANDERGSALRLTLIVVGIAALYGVAMASFDLGDPECFFHLLFVAIKTPLLLLATSAMCLPGFFVLNTVVGLRDDFQRAWRAILTGQAALSVTLASLAPLTLVWYASDVTYRGALLFNAGTFAIATLAGHFAMRRGYRQLIARNPRHRKMLFVWVVLYSFVGIQMGWMLRPFIGDPAAPVGFFRPEPFSNAYVVVVRLFAGN